MTDEQIDKLGTYFVYHNLRERFGWTFEKFVERRMWELIQYV